MTEIAFHQVDAFVTDRGALTGNPAAVMPLDAWLPDELLQDIAVENNLSETAFLVPAQDDDADYHLRWFTPTCEVDLCGHATLASAHVMLDGRDTVRFATRAGILTATREGDKVRIDLPAATGDRPLDDAAFVSALGVEAERCFVATGAEDAFVALLADEAAVRACRPDFAALMAYEGLVVVTAPGEDHDVASRVFAPFYGIDEDPVTGAAHAAIAPWWARRLQRDSFTAVQASTREGWLDCNLAGDRVALSGRCVSVIEGRFNLDLG